jgi:hypothetical protein
MHGIAVPQISRYHPIAAGGKDETVAAGERLECPHQNTKSSGISNDHAVYVVGKIAGSFGRSPAVRDLPSPMPSENCLRGGRINGNARH